MRVLLNELAMTMKLSVYVSVCVATLIIFGRIFDGNVGTGDGNSVRSRIVVKEMSKRENNA